MAQGTATRSLSDLQSSRDHDLQDERAKRKVAMIDSTSMDERPSTAGGLTPLYGPTGALCMILSVPLPSGRLRKTDGSIIVKASELQRNSMARGECKKIKRAKGVERQWRWNCPDCGMTLAYQAKEWGDEAPYLYVLQDAVSPDALWGTREALRSATHVELPAWVEGRDGGSRLEVEVNTGCERSALVGPSKCGSRLVLDLDAPAAEDERNNRLLQWAGQAFMVEEGRVSIDWSAKGGAANSVVLVFAGAGAKPRQIMAKANSAMQR